MMKSLTFGLDIAKTVFHCVTMDEIGRIKGRKKLTRNQVLTYFVNQPAGLVVIEACGSSSYWAREIQKLGHEVKLIPPQHVVAYRRKAKNDYNDAEAIAEASSRPNMSFAMIKTIEQQGIQCVIKIRDSLIKQQTQLSNEARGHLLEFGLTLNRGHKAIREVLPEYLEDAESGLPFAVRKALFILHQNYLDRQKQIEELEKEIILFTKEQTVCKMAQSIPGIGPIISATVFASIGNGQTFKNGRHFAAWLGLVPRQNSSGGKTVLGGITKKGNVYLRQLLVHGARSLLFSLSRKPKDDWLSRWASALRLRTHWNKACVAIANKLARIVWSVIAHQQPYVEKVA